MIWYYTNEEGKQVGPVEEAEFNAKVKSGVILGDTYVWKEGFPQWIKYSEAGQGAAGRDAATGASERCSECGGNYPQNEMVNFAGVWVCATCKPVYVQKLREGAPTGSAASGWRSGKRLVMPVNVALPPRCIKCNAPVDDPQKKRKLYWHHPAIYFALILRVIPYLVLALIFRKKSTTFVSVCTRHRAVRRNSIIVSWVLLLGGIAAFSVGITRDLGWLTGSGVVLFVGAIIYGIARGRLVYATKIDKEHMWLGGCKPAFLAEFPEWTGPK